MKCLIVEDDLVSSHVLEKMISRYGTYDTTVSGKDAADLFRYAHESKSPYDLILMDIMIPEVDGLQAVLTIRKTEVLLDIPLTHRVKVIMTTALDDPRTLMKALYESDANSYIVKPVRLQQLDSELRALKMIP